jgi:uncharacterized cupin superfamily protein
MKKINTRDVPEEPWSSPKGKFASADRNISIKLGREPDSMDLMKRQPFDVEICRIPAGKSACPFHSHSAQWEFYHVISGTGTVRDPDGVTAIEEGDAFIFEPGRPHQISSDSSGDLVVYVIADNPVGETGHYPDSNKWLVRSPVRALIRSGSLDYLDGEE